MRGSIQRKGILPLSATGLARQIPLKGSLGLLHGPTGLQIIGRRDRDLDTLKIGAQIEGLAT